MIFEIKLNEDMEVDYLEGIEKNGATKTVYTVNPAGDIFHIEQSIHLGKKVIFKDDFTLDRELLKALNKAIKEYDI